MNINTRSKVDTTDDQEMENEVNTLIFNGAEVRWPPDCPDDMLKFAIERAGMCLKGYNIDTQGVKVERS